MLRRSGGGWSGGLRGETGLEMFVEKAGGFKCWGCGKANQNAMSILGEGVGWRIEPVHRGVE